MIPKINSEREAYLFGRQQISIVPEHLRLAFLKGARDNTCKIPEKILDPEVEEAYKRLLSVYKTKVKTAKALGVTPSNLYGYTTGRSTGPKVKEKFLAALKRVQAAQGEGDYDQEI